ncbi:meiosis protein SPO22/ZIP4 like-domain-containing protein [Bisporella sp. PMI_857]|nr:meiosis protein SPO22/ZIP4 like-domain-containing protein [Bisporella sp. PMI_857]
MAPHRLEKDKRFKAILSKDLQKHIAEFPSPKSLGEVAASRCEETDSIATALWNLCTRLRRKSESDSPRDVPAILLTARVFAFILLGCALEAGKGDTANVVRCMRVGIKAAKNCISRNYYEYALKVLEKIASFEDKLKQPDADISAGDGEVHARLTAEYYILRTSLAWRQNQLDMAEHMFKKSMSCQQCFDPNTAESLADVLFELGKDLLVKREYLIAVKWLERSYHVLSSQELDKLSSNASELRLSIAESLIKANLAVQDSDATQKAQDLLATLENDMGDKMVVLLLKLEILSGTPDEIFDSSAYCDILQRMIRSGMLSESKFSLIMYHIRKLNDKSPSLACKALDEFLPQVLRHGSEHELWIEKVIVTRIWMTMNQKDGLEDHILLNRIFSLVLSDLQKPIASAATLAAHTLLWKRIESTYAQSQYDNTENWCRVAMHKIFETSGEINFGRITRKLLLCALAKQDFNAGRDIWGAMTDATRSEPMTRFLMYKIAIRCNEVEFAAECLNLVSHQALDDPTLLYACVLDAQQIGNKSQALAALQLVLDKHRYTSAANVHLPSLIRLTIKLSCSILDETTEISAAEASDANVERLCKLFEGAIHAVKKPPTVKSENIWTVLELDWFSKNSYNLAIKHMPTWHPRHLVRMLTCCIDFINRHPDDAGTQLSEDLSLRKMFCEFSITTALVALARGEDDIELSLQEYLRLRKHVESYDALLQEKLPKMPERPYQDLLQKLSILLAFDFEAVCQLKNWNALSEIIAKAEACKNAKAYEIMADCILCANPPTEVLITTLKKIINSSWELETLNGIKLAKYMRCLFQVCLSSNPDVAEDLLEQIESLARECGETEQPYPAEELEWVITRAFNHAIDLYCNEQDEKCKSWGAKALSLAHHCADSGDLRRLLESKWAGLIFDSG